LIRTDPIRIPQAAVVGCPEDSKWFGVRAWADRPDRWRKALVALEESEEVPSDCVFRMLMPHPRFTLSPQDRFKTLTIIRFYPEKVPKGVVIYVGETPASGMHGNMMDRTGACLDTTAHRTRIPSSEAKFRDGVLDS
jgi:hypothetical protein